MQNSQGDIILQINNLNDNKKDETMELLGKLSFVGVETFEKIIEITTNDDKFCSSLSWISEVLCRLIKNQII